MNSEKECVPNANIEKCAVVLLDVAGTTTSLDFVKEKLFTFAADNAQTFLKENWEDEEIKKAVKLLQDGDAELDVDGAIKVFKKLTGENSDNKGLKTLQGLVYKKGYTDNALKAHVFSDVPKAFENWSKERKVAIYSTGSIESQKLLFTHSTEGDLSQYISHYFDQSVGLKTESGSYKKIAEELKVKEEEIIFINDKVDELKAAKEVGLLPILVKREGNEEVSEETSKNFTVISSFTDLCLDNPNKRKNEDEIDGTEAPPTKIAKTDEQASDASTAAPTAEVVKEVSEAVEESADAKEKSKIVEEKTEEPKNKPDATAEKQETKEQPVEKTKPESTSEPMEVDAPEIQNNTAAEDKKTDSATENDATNAVDKKVEVAEAMETEQSTEKAVVDVKTAVEPVADSKTDKVDVKTAVEPVADSKTDKEKVDEDANKVEAIEIDKELLKKAEQKETMETDHKTEESHPKKDVEVASNTESVDVKKNGVAVEIVEVEVLEKETENVEVAEETKEIVKDEEQKLVEANTEIAKEATEINKDEINLATDAVENKNEESNCETNTDKTTKEPEKAEAQQNSEPKEEKVTEEVKEELKEPKEADNAIKPSKEQPAQAEKSSEEIGTVSASKKECPEETKQAIPEKCSEETKETEKAPTVKEECQEKNKETKETEIEDKVKVTKNELTNNENIVSETVAKELKDNIEETVKAQENTSENKIGNGSCNNLNAAETVAKNGEIANGQENGDKKNDETDPEETDIKIKKLETNAGSPAVSVEV